MDMLKGNKYISLKEMQKIKEEYYANIIKCPKIKKYFKRRKMLKSYKKLDKIITEHNNKYINEEIENSKYILDNINGYKLDLEQKKAVITDEDSLLIVAGAGSGKTLTMIGKIKYLVEHKKINPKEILCISFTNFTTDSLKKSIAKQSNYKIDVFTFHKLSLEIIKKKGININICEDKLLVNIINNFFTNELPKNRKNLYDFITNYLLLKSIKLNENAKETIKEEIIIGNYLYFNQIDYEYKKIGIYQNKLISVFYLTKYKVYIKFYNQVDNDNNLSISNFLSDIENIRKYLKGNILELYPHNFKDGTIFDEINNFFNKNNIKTNQNINVIYNKYLLTSDKNLSNLIISFINMFKASDHPYTKFDEIQNKILNQKNKLEKNKLLIIFNIIKQIYNNYQIYLKQNNMLDFNDMITLATTLIENTDVILNYKYIIIDEYQDTSYCRYKLIKAIKKSCMAKLIAVGDDFQSIYRFTGCDIDMFLNFSKYFKYSKTLYLTNTYRNSGELIKVAGDFIMKNKYQISKMLKSNKKLYKPIKIYFYKSKNEITNLFDKITEDEIFVLGRNNSDINLFDNNAFKIDDSKIKYLKKDINITYMSIHKSKGLESSAALIVNLENKKLGFPSQIEEDILIHYLTNLREYYPFDEERRLFYVALTRTKGNVYLFVPYKNRSIFVSEIIKDNKKLIEIIN